MSTIDNLVYETAQIRHGLDYYEKAFYRNLGLISGEEQARLRRSCVAIPGMGGLGSTLISALVRTGIGNFRIADYADYNVIHTNRQAGAATHTIGRNKAQVMAEIAASINPEVKVTVFTEPISDVNIEQFLGGADVVVDALDLFLLDTRKLLYRIARKMNMYAILPVNLGFSATMHIFSPRGMSFEEYFNFQDDDDYQTKLLSFLVGLSPRGIHKKYMSDNFIDVSRKRLPAVAAACQIASGMTVTEVLNIILKRKPVMAAPYYSQFDPYLMKYKRGYLIGGNRNPLQKLRLLYAKYFGSLPAGV